MHAGQSTRAGDTAMNEPTPASGSSALKEDPQGQVVGRGLRSVKW